MPPAIPPAWFEAVHNAVIPAKAGIHFDFSPGGVATTLLLRGVRVRNSENSPFVFTFDSDPPLPGVKTSERRGEKAKGVKMDSGFRRNDGQNSNRRRDRPPCLSHTLTKDNHGGLSLRVNPNRRGRIPTGTGREPPLHYRTHRDDDGASSQIGPFVVLVVREALGRRAVVAKHVHGRGRERMPLRFLGRLGPLVG